MQLNKAERKKSKIKIALQGAAGSGKSYSALMLGYGLCRDWSKIAIIDSENKSANLYAHLGEYYVLNMEVPYTPEKYIEAITICLKANMQVIILDGISQAWSGTGGILDIHASMAGNSFTNWAKVTPRHNAFVDSILNANAHLIATLRTKQEYVLQEKNGKLTPEKVGLKAVQREDTDYEFTLVFNIDCKHNAIASKDRTGLFANQPECRISVETGDLILKWCNEQVYNAHSKEDVISAIELCANVDELLALFKSHPEYQESLLQNFKSRRTELETNQIINNQNILINGTTNSPTGTAK